MQVKEKEDCNLASVCQDCWHNLSTFHEFYCRIEKIFAENTLNEIESEIKTEDFDINENALGEIFSQALEPLTDTSKPKNEYPFDIAEGKSSSVNVEQDEGIIREDSVSKRNHINTPLLKALTDVTETEFSDREENCRKSKRNRTKRNSKGKSRERAKNWKEIEKFYNLECDLCAYRFQSCVDIRKHYSSEHHQTGYLRCCGINFFAIPQVLLDHIIYHRNPMKFR